MELILKKDLIIPKGTVFKNCDNEVSRFIYDNYDTCISLDNDTTARIIVSSENKDFFEVIMKEKIFSCKYAEAEGCFGSKNCRYVGAEGCMS